MLLWNGGLFALAEFDLSPLCHPSRSLRVTKTVRLDALGPHLATRLGRLEEQGRIRTVENADGEGTTLCMAEGVALPLIGGSAARDRRLKWHLAALCDAVEAA